MGFIVWLAVVAAAIIPLMKLLPHFGVNKNWAFVAFLPFAVVILLWVMAMKLQELERR
ncbi:hypothetical protein [Marivita sp. S2033]|uniref:hypothetical protein n=1 Tax=Marivita sp. S2033 TaxID=3373187 RepID=UPI0039826308